MHENRNEQILSEAFLLLKLFEKVLQKSSPFEIKGILNSEILFFVTVCRILNSGHVIESGRARGQSTELISRWLSEGDGNVKFDSIEFDRVSEDVEVATHRLSQIDFPVNLLFGDARKKLPELVRDDTEGVIVLIDGPKGPRAVQLALDALSDERVRAVCVHDLHKNDKDLRELVELWPSFVSSDQEEFVKCFSYLDQPCWEEHQKYERFKGWGPYQRGSKRMLSYGPTLVALFNDLDPIERDRAVKRLRWRILFLRSKRYIRSVMKWLYKRVMRI